MNILVAGLGNSLHGDDGFGSVVARLLACKPHREDVSVIDFGNRCFDLVTAMLEPLEAVIILDAIVGPGPPGTLRVLDLSPASGDDGAETGVELHTMEPRTLVRMARRLGSTVKTVLVVGCDIPAPAANRPGIGLSEAVRQAVPAAVRHVEGLIDRLRQPVNA